ncbi:MAG: KpsF/GutQ family sugar-phosphate isomerase [Bacteroidetes bacterium]|nr:KpsF/GutQ family sugar-phosphate isomerase [Bacteroidota bacterium]
MTDNDIISAGKTAIDIEFEALRELRDSIDNSFVSALRSIQKSSGRLIVTGIGKSAIVGQKIVATMNSTGTPALFMHAADAIHGDLGMLRSEDVVLCISKSGQTNEIRVLVPLINSFENTLIGMTANSNSFLAEQAEIVLLTPIKKEADPNNLAPTASTTSQMAMGDALATALLAFRGFTPADFAQYHPGGALGKQLYLKVKDLAKFNQKPLVNIQSSLRATLLEISEKRLGATAVETSGDIVGIVTDGDIRRFLEKDTGLSNVVARDIMTANPQGIQANEFAIRALNQMRKENIHQLIVFDEDQYFGFIHLHDLVREGIV